MNKKTTVEIKAGGYVAEIPMVIYQKAVREGWAEDKKKFKEWLNDPDNKMFRSWKGRV
jgi:hypothetical protein